ncbi:hypothetical protein BHF71_09230 [Vulcanibacillus modesticaldus]|uniref:Uncharacterized protein n=1 Tax=Vulcanibacillus modesticaldus TaxID=337097 RepID=A0A1D2YUG6_9BACI|nr:hypothetical protein [Vulcanibacillus modesticaldus]OEF99295.1 hypothetical protein BHF71_09230 [Vulcanibacillus modesticaldus]
MIDRIKISGNELITNSFRKVFEYLIKDYIVIQGFCIVLLQIPKDSKKVDNVYGVSLLGDITWRIQSVQDAFNITQNTPYISIDLNSEGNLTVTNFFGMRYVVNHTNGKLLKKECIRW